ncbi:hypothetical protein ACVGXE_09530 [Escherichia coli]
MTETGGQPPVSFPVKDVAVLLFLIRPLNPRGKKPSSGHFTAYRGHGKGPFNATGLRRLNFNPIHI